MRHLCNLAEFRARLEEHQIQAQATQLDYSQTIKNSRMLIVESRQVVADADMALGLGYKLHDYFSKFPNLKRS